MMYLDQGPMSENIITITLEVVQMLTGEDYMVVKKCGDHMIPCVAGGLRGIQPLEPLSHSYISEGMGNERRILELTNRIIHLLSGEVWKYLGHSSLHSDPEVTEHHQPIPPVESPDDFSAEIKAESAPRKEGIDVEKPRDGHTEEGAGSAELVYRPRLLSIKEELLPVISRAQDLPDDVKEESGSRKENLKDSNVSEAAGPTPRHSSPGVKGESVLFREENAPDAEMASISHAQDLSAHIKQELESAQDTDSYTQIDYLIPFTDECSGDDSDSPGADRSAIKNNGRCYQGSKTPNQKNYKCSECPKCFTRNADLLKHQRVHGRAQSIICSDCGKTFAKNSLYVRHQRIHTGEKPFSCSDCGKTFSVSAHLITHQRIHTGEKPFVCSDCGKSFNQKASLIKHRRTHTGEKPFVCADCGKCFTSSTNLTLHQRIHTGEKPYACSVCGKRFRSSPNLISHQRIHTGEKPYSCSECGKFFTNSSVLVRHQRTHTGEKPFLCAECGKCFTRNSQLIKHQMIHAGQRPYAIKGVVIEEPQRWRYQSSMCSPSSSSLSEMGKDGSDVAERVVDLALEIIFLLTGEDYNVTRKTPAVLGGWSRTQIPLLASSPSVVNKRINEEKVLQITNKIIELLSREGEDPTGIKMEAAAEETPVRCEEPPPGNGGPGDISSDGSVAKRSESGPCREENVPQIWNRREEVTNMKAEDDLCIEGYQQCKEEDDPVEISSGDPGRSLQEQIILLPDFEAEESNIAEEGPGGLVPAARIPGFPPDRGFIADSCNRRELYSKIIHGGAGRFYPCPLCGKLFKKNSSLSMHMRIHRDERPYPCLQCGKSFTQNSILVEHQRIHTGEKPFSCSDCGKFFAQRSALVKHERSHTGEKPFTCLECWKCFTRKDHLERHQRIHRGERPFPCSECGKCFTRISVLVAHQRIHTGEKPYSCAQCGKYFAYKSVLIEHEKTHTGEKPFSCSECGKRFAQKATLVAHQRTHTGEKPFSCSECGKGFTLKSGLVRHQRTHVEERPCSECGKCFGVTSDDVVHCTSYTGDNSLVKCYLCKFLPQSV
ncbi:uncharacterized protein [Engystomops pustulosus]|uniref:uncharacterized protein n=1 Tax=Engystomops pustulosus TaxID=76066 RepID=UPI003AFB02B9